MQCHLVYLEETMLSSNWLVMEQSELHDRHYPGLTR